MIDAQARVRLAPRVRLRFDRHSGRHVLLYPERGLELNASGERIAALCVEERPVAEIVELLAAGASDTPRDLVERDVLAFLGALEGRGLLEVSHP
ncbi:MAG TPA: pyrroloquinoline quinone biosynthesis peptide chaperone PqqD [Polyangiaceae bacterium]|nr:pyrroloquinoline quinone biosynthesis peptide chaperone PqqD [Polyangiaceae bacterium]